MSIIGKLLQAGAKYGRKFTDWVRNNTGRIMDWVNAGMSFEWIYNKIREILGL